MLHRGQRHCQSWWFSCTLMILLNIECTLVRCNIYWQYLFTLIVPLNALAGCQRFYKNITSVVDAGDACITGIVDTGKVSDLLANFNSTGEAWRHRCQWHRVRNASPLLLSPVNCVQRPVILYQTYFISILFCIELILFWTYFIPNLFYTKLILYRTCLYQIYFTPNLYYTELILYQTYFILNLFYTKFILYPTYITLILFYAKLILYLTCLIPNLFYTQLILHWTYFILNLFYTELV